MARSVRSSSASSTPSRSPADTRPSYLALPFRRDDGRGRSRLRPPGDRRRTFFCLEAVRADGYRQYEFSKRAGKQPVRLSTVDFTGILVVANPSCFLQDALCRGLGPAKGFGCGLMLVRRASP